MEAPCQRSASVTCQRDISWRGSPDRVLALTGAGWRNSAQPAFRQMTAAATSSKGARCKINWEVSSRGRARRGERPPVHFRDHHDRVLWLSSMESESLGTKLERFAR